MRDFTVTDHNERLDYELCDSSDYPGEKCLKMTLYRNGEFTREENVNLSDVNPEFFEEQVEKKSFPWIKWLFVCMGGLIYFSSLFVFLYLISCPFVDLLKS